MATRRTMPAFYTQVLDEIVGVSENLTPLMWIFPNQGPDPRRMPSSRTYTPADANLVVRAVICFLKVYYFRNMRAEDLGLGVPKCRREVIAAFLEAEADSLGIDSSDGAALVDWAVERVLMNAREPRPVRLPATGTSPQRTVNIVLVEEGPEGLWLTSQFLQAYAMLRDFTVMLGREFDFATYCLQEAVRNRDLGSVMDSLGAMRRQLENSLAYVRARYDEAGSLTYGEAVDTFISAVREESVRLQALLTPPPTSAAIQTTATAAPTDPAPEPAPDPGSRLMSLPALQHSWFEMRAIADTAGDGPMAAAAEVDYEAEERIDRAFDDVLALANSLRILLRDVIANWSERLERSVLRREAAEIEVATDLMPRLAELESHDLPGLLCAMVAPCLTCVPKAGLSPDFLANLAEPPKEPAHEVEELIALHEEADEAEAAELAARASFVASYEAWLKQAADGASIDTFLAPYLSPGSPMSKDLEGWLATGVMQDRIVVCSIQDVSERPDELRVRRNTAPLAYRLPDGGRLYLSPYERNRDA